MSDTVPCPSCGNPTYAEIWAMRNFGVCANCHQASLQEDGRRWGEQMKDAMNERGLGDAYRMAQRVAKRMFE